MDEAHYICTYIRERKKDLYLLFAISIFHFIFAQKPKTERTKIGTL